VTFANDRVDAVAQRARQTAIDLGPRAVQLKETLHLIDNSPSMAAQRQRQAELFGNDRPVGGTAGIVESSGLSAHATVTQAASPTPAQLNAHDPVQNRDRHQPAAQTRQQASAPNQAAAAPKSNGTGLPDALKSGLEALSGIALDLVRVHYNSAQPARLNAMAYAQGRDIHLAPGQEAHLPHEAWHVVQQAQGRVRPTMQMTGGVEVNDDGRLEQEADSMGRRAVELKGGGRGAGIDPLAFGGPDGSVKAVQLRQVPAKASHHPTQLKPKDIKGTHTLSVDAAGNVTNGEAGRDAVPVSYPLNALIFHKIVKASPVIGGHLFKREYGGPDDFSNVVTWGQGSEDAYTTFENQYLGDARTAATTGEEGAHDRTIKTEATFKTKKVNVSNMGAGDGDKSREATDARHKLSKLISGGLETIPEKVKVTAQGRGPWERAGQSAFVSGDLSPDTSKIASLYALLKTDAEVERIDTALGKIDEM
jgi:hypothetical protein